MSRKRSFGEMEGTEARGAVADAADVPDDPNLRLILAEMQIDRT